MIFKTYFILKLGGIGMGIPSVPSKLFVLEKSLREHPILVAPIDGMDAGAQYARDRVLQIESLIKVIANDTQFHTDGLLFSIHGSERLISRAFELRGNEGESSTPFSSSDLISGLYREGEPGVNKRYHSQIEIDRLAVEYVSNYDVVYIPDVFDDATFTKVRDEFLNLLMFIY